MALHRDIFWVGRQWAVTGHGLQAVDQKQKSKFDVEISRLWDEDLANGLSAERWFNAEDFSKGLAIARARYPELPRDVGQVQPPRPIESRPEPVPPCQQPLSARTLAPVALPNPAPQAEPPIAGAAPAAAPDTWASLAELARTAVAAPPRKGPAPERVAPPTADVFTAPARPAPRLDLPGSTAAVIEPPKPACLSLPLDMHVERSGARFSRMWRVQLRR